MEMGKSERVEVILWSIALPGFGQLLNGKLVKGILLIGLEFIINVQSSLNHVIILSFHGDISQAIRHTDYQWLMFYPCVYMFGIWDAYRDRGGGQSRFSVLPFVLAAYLGTIGVIYSVDILGAVWLGILGMLVGVGIGLLILKGINRKRESNL